MRALSFGEILWDIIEGNEHLGGAPFNLASHLAQMGADSVLVSAVGDDDRGRRALEIASKHGMETGFIGTDGELETGTVLVELDEHGSPAYDIREHVAWDRIDPTSAQLSRLKRRTWDVLTFGTLAQRSEHNRDVLDRIAEAASPRECFFDVNLRLDYYDEEVVRRSMEKASILKLNNEEVPEISRLLYGEEVLDREFCERTEKEWDVHTTCITRGKQGASVYRSGEYYHIPVVPVKVADTVGAGDSFSAAFLYGLFTTGEVKKSGDLAALVSSFVASRNGAVPAYDEPVRKAIYRLTRESREQRSGGESTEQ